MSNRTNWKNLGRQQGGNMKNNRNMKVDKMHFNNGKWDTIYTADNLKRLAYYNIDVPSIVGIGTNRPFSKLSFGDSSDSGHHVSGNITPGKVSAIALHEKLTNIDDVLKEGQEFTGLSYVTNLRSIRKLEDNTEAKGLAFYSNKTSETEDTSMKTDKGLMYITDDNYIHIGGKPKGYNLIDTRGINRKIPAATQETGPAILLDVSGSIHVNGFINFLKNGNETVNYLTDNPANQMTYRDGEIQYIDPDSTTPADQDTALNLGAVPEGAIWVGFEKPLATNTSTTALAATPRLYLMRAGKATRVLIEGDAAAGSDGGTTGGLTFDGSTDSDNSNLTPFYVFRNTSQVPGNVLMNTYVGYPTNSNNIASFGSSDNPLPVLLNTDRSFPAGNQEAPCVVSIMGGLAVFDSTKGGSNADYLDYTSTTTKFDGNKVILESDIYTRTESGKKPQTELGIIYTDRHLMIGGCSSYNGISNTNHKQPFKKMSSAIDVSGGIVNKPLIRSITGNNRGTSDDSSLVTANVNAQDSIIVGNTPPAYFNGYCKESIVVGTHDQGGSGSSSIIDNVNTLVMGKQCQSKYINNSLVVGYQCKSGPTSEPSVYKDGVVSLGYNAKANTGTDADVRFAFGTHSGAGDDGNVFTIDKKGNVVIQAPGGASLSSLANPDNYASLTVKGNLTVEGNHTELQVQKIIAEDKAIDLNATISSTGATVGASAITSDDHVGGIRLFTNNTSGQRIGFTYYKTSGGASRWTTGYDSGNNRGSNNVDVGIGVGGEAGEEDFVIDKNGNFYLARDSTGNAPNDYYVHIKGTSDTDKGNMIFYQAQGRPTLTFKRPVGDIDLSGNIRIDPEANFGLGAGPSAPVDKKALTIGGGYTAAANSQPEGFELEHKYTSASKAVVNMKVSGETILGGYGTAGYLKVRNYDEGSNQSNAVVDIDEEKTKSSPGTAKMQMVRVSGGYASDKGLSMNRENKPYGTTNDYRVNLEMGGSLTVDGCHENFAATSTKTIAQFFAPYSSGGVEIDISKNAAGDTKANMKIAGKLTVDGLIDPTGLVLNNQGSTNPNAGNNSSKTTIWSHGGILKFENGTGGIKTIATTSGGGSSGGLAGNTDAANKVFTANSDNSDISYNILFSTMGITGSSGGTNKSVYVEDRNLTYNTSTNTLTAANFDGVATSAKTLAGTAPTAASFVKWGPTGITTLATAYTLPAGTTGALGGVKIGQNLNVDTNGVISGGYATATPGSTGSDGLMSSGDKTKLDKFTNAPAGTSGDATKFLNQKGNFETPPDTTDNDFINSISHTSSDSAPNTFTFVRNDDATTTINVAADIIRLGYHAGATGSNAGGDINIKAQNSTVANGGNITLTAGTTTNSSSSAGKVKIASDLEMASNKKITTTSGDLEIAPNGSSKVKIGGSAPVITTNGTKNLVLSTNDMSATSNTSSAIITVENGGSTAYGNIILNPAGGASTGGSIIIGSGNDANRKIKCANGVAHTGGMGGEEPGQTLTIEGADSYYTQMNGGNILIKSGDKGPNNHASLTTTGERGDLTLDASGVYIKSHYIELQAQSGETRDIIIKHDDRVSNGNGTNLTINGQQGSGYTGSAPTNRYGNHGGNIVLEGGAGANNAGNNVNTRGDGGDIILKGGVAGTGTGTATNEGNPGNVVIDSSSNLLFGMPDTDLDFTMKMPRSTVGADAKILKIEGQHAADSGSFNGGDIEITAGKGHRSTTGNVNGGNVIISGGGFTSDTTPTGTGINGYVHITSNMELGAGTALDYTIQHKTLTNDGSGNKLTITGQNAKGDGTDSHGFSAGNIEIKAGSGSNADSGASASTNANGGDGGNIILTPGDGGNNVNSGTDGNNGYVEINSTENSTSTTSGALQVKGGVGIANNLNVGGAVGITGTLTAGTIVTTQVNVPLDIVTTSTPSPVASKIYAVTIDNSTTTTTMTLPNIGAVGDTIKFVFRCDATSNNVIFAAANSTSFDNTKSYIVISSDGIAANPSNGSAIYAPATNNNTITIGSANTGTFGTLTFIASTSAKWSVVGDIQCTGNVTSTTIFSTTT